MSNPVIRSFQRDTEARFPEEDSVPENLRPWWAETRENLERLKDKIFALESENQSLKESLSGNTKQFTESQAEQLARFVQYWEIRSSGSLVPYTDNTSDIGAAEYKVKDFYLNQN